jgi:hypothetical protein
VSAFTKRLDPVLYSPEEEAHIHAIAQDASHLFPMDKVFASRFFSCSEDQTLLVTEISRQILEQNTHYQNHLCWLLDVGRTLVCVLSEYFSLLRRKSSDKIIMENVKTVEIADGDEKEDVKKQLHDMENEDDFTYHNDQEEEETQPESAPSGLWSKSWSISSAHVPTFTGGKVTHSYNVEVSSTAATNGTGDDAENYVEYPTEQQQHAPKPFLLMPVHGDVAIVDSTRGIQWGTLRTGVDENNGYALTNTAAAGGNQMIGLMTTRVSITMISRPML